MSKLHETALDCLAIASLPRGSLSRRVALQHAANRWSWRIVSKKCHELARRGYIEPRGTGMGIGNVTDKGRRALETTTQADGLKNIRL